MPVELRLTRFEPRFAALVASWAPSRQEARAWCASEQAPVPAFVVEGWSTQEDVDAFVLVDAQGTPVAYGETWFDAGENEVELARLIVDPGHRGRGIGRLLARRLVDHAREAHPGLGLIALRLLPGNGAALRAYAGAGFVRVDAATETAWNAGQRTAWAWMRLA